MLEIGKHDNRSGGEPGGLILAERVMFRLGTDLGKHTAHGLVREAAMRALRESRPFKETLLEQPSIATHLSAEELDELLDPTTYTGLSAQATDRAIAFVKQARGVDSHLMPEGSTAS